MRRFATTLCLLVAGLLVPSLASADHGIPDCEDGIDNDGDGLIDFPADPGCESPTGLSEVNAPLDGGFDGGFAVFDAGLDQGRPLGDQGLVDDLGSIIPPPVNGGPVIGGGVNAQRPVTSGCEIGVLSEGGTVVLVILITLAIALVRRGHGSAHRSG